MKPHTLVALLLSAGVVALVILWWRASTSRSRSARSPPRPVEPLLRKTPRRLQEVIYNPKGFRRRRDGGG